MNNKIKIKKGELKKLYENKKLTTFQIADLIGCGQTTIWKKLKKYSIKSRLPGTARVNISKESLKDFYINKRLSTWKIERKLNIPRGTIYRKLKEFNLLIRDRSDSHIRYQKKDFSGNKIEKAYLIGFRLGDLGVKKQYPKSKTIVVASGSTIKEQIRLIKKLFNNYGHIWSKNSGNKINILIILNTSFEFLINKDFPLWVEKNNKFFFSFLAGFTDAEGCISKNNNLDYYSLGNYDKNLLFAIHRNLNKFEIKCKPPWEDNRKGKTNSQGYIYSSNYWSLRIHDKENLLKLLLALKPYIKHKNKIKALYMAISSIKDRNRRNQNA